MSDDQSNQEAKQPAEESRGDKVQSSNEVGMSRQSSPHDNHLQAPSYQDAHYSYPTMYPNEHFSPETNTLMRGIPPYEPSAHYAPYSYPPYGYHQPDYSYPPPPPPPSYRSFHSEPRRSLQPRRSSPESYHSAQYNRNYHRDAPYWDSPRRDNYFDPAAFRDASLEVSPYASHAFASSARSDEHYPGTTPPQVGANNPMPLQNVDAPFKTEDCSGVLNPDEGFDSPPYHNESSPNVEEDDRKQPSVPNNIYLNDQYTPSPPDISTFYESPMSTAAAAAATSPNQTNLAETAPQMPSFNRAETNQSDVANSSSNSSSLGASTSSCSDFGWNKHYQALVRYKQRKGTCDVPQKHTEGHLNLGVWVNKVSLVACLGKP